MTNVRIPASLLYNKIPSTLHIITQDRSNCQWYIVASEYSRRGLWSVANVFIIKIFKTEGSQSAKPEK